MYFRFPHSVRPLITFQMSWVWSAFNVAYMYHTKKKVQGLRLVVDLKISILPPLMFCQKAARFRNVTNLMPHCPFSEWLAKNMRKDVLKDGWHRYWIIFHKYFLCQQTKQELRQVLRKHSAIPYINTVKSQFVAAATNFFGHLLLRPLFEGGH